MSTLIDKVLKENSIKSLREEDFAGIDAEEFREVQERAKELVKELQGKVDWCDIIVKPYGTGFKIEYSINPTALKNLADEIMDEYEFVNGWEFIDRNDTKDGFTDFYR